MPRIHTTLKKRRKDMTARILFAVFLFANLSPILRAEENTKPAEWKLQAGDWAEWRVSLPGGKGKNALVSYCRISVLLVKNEKCDLRFQTSFDGKVVTTELRGVSTDELPASFMIASDTRLPPKNAKVENFVIKDLYGKDVNAREEQWLAPERNYVLINRWVSAEVPFGLVRVAVGETEVYMQAFGRGNEPEFPRKPPESEAEKKDKEVGTKGLGD
jgi:hypothetical protein